MVRVGLVGLGYWGPNLVRNFSSLRDCQVTAICDRNPKRLQHVSEMYPAAFATTDSDELFASGKVDAVVIGTPTRTHYAIAKSALQAGLHTFVEKPLATSSRECSELIRMADERDLVLFVGHVFLYSAAVAKLKKLVEAGELGDLCYISSVRLNLGPIRSDVNALWDLAPHDISIMLHLMDAVPEAVSCSGLAHLKENVHDVCSVTMHFSEKRLGLIHVSWLDPHKRRLMTVVGNKKMAAYDDIEVLEKIKVYDIGVEAPTYADSFGDFQYSYRYGDTYSPRIAQGEPLKSECSAFIDCISQRLVPVTDGRNGLDVVRVLEAAQQSLSTGGGKVAVATVNASRVLDPVPELAVAGGNYA